LIEESVSWQYRILMIFLFKMPQEGSPDAQRLLLTQGAQQNNTLQVFLGEARERQVQLRREHQKMKHL
jgi:hypothetical protein